jgi:biopolymer transport protein ExbB/TolQ
MAINRFDEFYNISNGMGKGFVDLPYTLHTALYLGLSPQEYKEFRRGNSTDEELKKAQSIYDEWYEETHPSEETLRKRRLQSQARDEKTNLERKLKLAKDRLTKLDKVARRDEQLPIGEREKLRREIEQLEKRLQTRNALDATLYENECESDWMESFLR